MSAAPILRSSKSPEQILPKAVRDPVFVTLGRKPLRIYDHSEFHPSIRPTDVFLCTFPKSGTSWLGYLIAQALKPDANETLDLKTFGRYVPDVNAQYTRRGGSLADFCDYPNPRLFRCHATFDANLPRVVYVLRDPRDAMLSYWHYKHFLKADFGMSLAEFLQSGDHWPCEWDQHVESWLSTPQHPNLLLLRYEQMQADTIGTLRSVLDFAGAKCSEDRLIAAVEASSFDRMREAEEKSDVQSKEGDPKQHCVRKGKIGSWREEMTAKQVRIIEEKYGQTMRDVGYETENPS